MKRCLLRLRPRPLVQTRNYAARIDTKELWMSESREELLQSSKGLYPALSNHNKNHLSVKAIIQRLEKDSNLNVGERKEGPEYTWTVRGAWLYSVHSTYKTKLHRLNQSPNFDPNP